LDLVALCRRRAIRVSLVPQPYDLYLSLPHLVDLGGLPLLQLGDLAAPCSAGIGKRLLDLALGSVLALLTLPLILAAAAALRRSAGRAFRWESRVGRNGVEFSMLRLNVERECEEKFGWAWFLSQLSLTELPQLWNVLRGEMSLVGPRPESPARAQEYSAWQQQRLTVKPGMTGLAQVHGLRERHSSEDKTRLDLQYMLRSSTLRDLSLLIETVWTLIGRLLKILRSAWMGEGAASSAAAVPPLAFAGNRYCFPERLQHADRTQSGTD
jgi:lipopolysaccharide/colanic/teichoic acid biosynthesis glycosyltransferase